MGNRKYLQNLYTYSNLNSGLYKSKNKSKSPRLSNDTNITRTKKITPTSSPISSSYQSPAKKTSSLQKSTKNKTSNIRSQNKNSSSLMTSKNQVSKVSQNHIKNDSQIPRKKSPRRKSPSFMVPTGY